MAQRVYKDKDVFTAAQERLGFVFSNFERVYISFSGGKDSGVLLNLVADYVRRHGIKDKCAVPAEERPEADGPWLQAGRDGG